jgi:hypothetical protein
MASCCGELFDDLILNKVNFFPQINNKILQRRLLAMSKLGVIECLGPQEKFKVYRFSDPVFRTVVYEKMLFNQRRSIHNQFKVYFKVNPIPEYMSFGMDNNLKKILEENILYLHFTESSPVTDDTKFLDVFQIDLDSTYRCCKGISGTCS